MGKFKERYENWKEWRKDNMNSKIHQWLVLFGVRESPSFEQFVRGKYFIKEFIDRFNSVKIIDSDSSEAENEGIHNQ